jgi:hypothetical protein
MKTKEAELTNRPLLPGNRFPNHPEKEKPVNILL